VLFVVAPIAAIVLITLFVFLRFPYDAFAPPLGHRLSAATGADIRIGGIDPRITIGGPGIAARDVIVLTPQGRVINIDPLAVRPAWSTSWLSGEPSLHVDFDTEIGAANGTLLVGESMGWNGELEQLDLARLPVQMPSGLRLSGLADADADLVLADGEISGDLVFEARSGSLGHPSVPMEIDFEQLTGELSLGGDNLAEIASLELDGQTLSASVSGVVQHARRPGRNPLDMNVDVEIKNPGMASMMRSMGVDVDSEGRISMRLSGSLQEPIPR
jgi:type II secretion system protein N